MIKKEELCRQHERELRKLWRGKPYRTKMILKIVDLTLNNLYSGERKNGDTIHRYLAFNKSVKPEDEQEYREMYSELLAVIRKYNRDWK